MFGCERFVSDFFCHLWLKRFFGPWNQADQGFPVGGRRSSRGRQHTIYDFAKFSKKLYEIWAVRGTHWWHPPYICHCSGGSKISQTWASSYNLVHFPKIYNNWAQMGRGAQGCKCFMLQWFVRFLEFTEFNKSSVPFTNKLRCFSDLVRTRGLVWAIMRRKATGDGWTATPCTTPGSTPSSRTDRRWRTASTCTTAASGTTLGAQTLISSSAPH